MNNNIQIDSIEDLKEHYGIDVENIEGFLTLNNFEQNRFKKFLINFYNTVIDKENIKIRSVYRARETELITREVNPIDVGYITERLINGKYEIYNIIVEGDNEVDDLDRLEPTSCIMVECSNDIMTSWIHVINENIWY